MTDLQIFNNADFGSVRIIQDGDKCLFCGSDVAKALGYTNPNKAINDHCRAITKRSTPISGKVQEINFITEGDVYRLITHSKLPSAERFEKWVFDEVLPTIRKTGGYVSNPDIFVDTYFPCIDNTAKIVLKSALKEIDILKANNGNLEKQIVEDKPKVEFADAMIGITQDSISIADMAKILNKNDLPLGRNRLFEVLRTLKILDSNNVPYQPYIDNKYFILREKYINFKNGDYKIQIVPQITGKGQIYVHKRIKDYYCKD